MYLEINVRISHHKPRIRERSQRANVQRSHRTRASNGETNNAASKYHAPYLTRECLHHRSKCKQGICAEYYFTSPEIVRQYTCEWTRDQREQTGTGGDQTFIECCQGSIGQI